MNPLPRRIGVRPFIKPAFLTVGPVKNGEADSLVVTSFGLFGGQDAVRHIPNLKDQVSADAFKEAPIKDLSRAINWPNGVQLAPEGMFEEESLVVAGGFLPPGRATGDISVVSTESGSKKSLTDPKSGWFYHQVEFHDMNADGLLDIVTARAKKPVIGNPGGEMVWLENPGDAGEWTEHPMMSGPDVHFRLADLNNDGRKEVVATQFFSKKLSLYYQQEGQWKEREIDGQVGSPFDLEFADVNNDGKEDLLITNHESDSTAGVFAYELPTDPINGEWKRRTLYQGFKTRILPEEVEPEAKPFQASPGKATAFFPHQGKTHEKPSILVSGDGTQMAHILTPRSLDPNDWNYSEHILIDAKSTVGQCAVKDVNNDGYAEIFVPAYDADLIHAFTYAPEGS